MPLTKPILVPPWADTAAGTDIQKPADGFITGGWPSSGTPPSRQFFNWILHFAMNGVRYLTRRGLPDWGNDETYVTGDVVRDSSGPSSGAIYSLTGTATLGLAPSADAANWELIFPKTNPVFGNGADGDVTITGGTTTFDAVNKQYNNLTITNTGVLEFHRGIIRVKGTLNIQNGGIIHANGAAASGSTGGLGMDGFGAGDNVPIGHGSSGANGTNNAVGSAPAAFATQTAAANVNGGADYTGYSANGGNGASGTNAGGSAPTIPASHNINAHISAISQAHTPGHLVFLISEVDVGEVEQGTAGGVMALHGGVGGASGGGAASGAGGGGGAGGGIVCIIANKVILGSTTCVRARGGAGGSPTGVGNCGGGGGGGGGRIIILHGGASGSTLDAANCVNGGAGAAGQSGGGTGSTGSQGQILMAQIT